MGLRGNEYGSSKAKTNAERAYHPPKAMRLEQHARGPLGQDAGVVWEIDSLCIAHDNTAYVTNCGNIVACRTELFLRSGWNVGHA